MLDWKQNLTYVILKPNFNAIYLKAKLNAMLHLKSKLNPMLCLKSKLNPMLYLNLFLILCYT